MMQMYFYFYVKLFRSLSKNISLANMKRKADNYKILTIIDFILNASQKENPH